MTSLLEGEIELIGRIARSSNFTFLVSIDNDESPDDIKGIYKPAEGEQPLGDFPPGLYKREIAAYRLSQALGWPKIPETIEIDGPLGRGSLQRFVDARFEEHYLSLSERPELASAFMEIAQFDIIANNADRKSGHCLIDQDGEIWAIDHGLCFNSDPKLRSVVWDFAGEAIPPSNIERALEVSKQLDDLVGDLLLPDEIAATRQRIELIASDPVLPAMVSEYQIPWPPV